jgi:hypothetical protein
MSAGPQAVSTLCPRCGGFADAVQFHFALQSGNLSIAQLRCRTCWYQRTSGNDGRPDQPAVLRTLHQARRVFALMLTGLVLALAVFGLAASALAAMR